MLLYHLQGSHRHTMQQLDLTNLHKAVDVVAILVCDLQLVSHLITNIIISILSSKACVIVVHYTFIVVMKNIHVFKMH